MRVEPCSIAYYDHTQWKLRPGQSFTIPAGTRSAPVSMMQRAGQVPCHFRPVDFALGRRNHACRLPLGASDRLIASKLQSPPLNPSQRTRLRKAPMTPSTMTNLKSPIYPMPEYAAAALAASGLAAKCNERPANQRNDNVG